MEAEMNNDKLIVILNIALLIFIVIVIIIEKIL